MKYSDGGSLRHYYCCTLQWVLFCFPPVSRESPSLTIRHAPIFFSTVHSRFFIYFSQFFFLLRFFGIRFFHTIFPLFLFSGSFFSFYFLSIYFYSNTLSQPNTSTLSNAARFYKRIIKTWARKILENKIIKNEYFFCT